MTREEREAFLADVHVAIISIAREGAAPLAVPVWYSYTPGGMVTVATNRSSEKGQALLSAGRYSLCAQDEAPPYRYVSVEGKITTVDSTGSDRGEVRAMAHRYLGIEFGDAFMTATADNADDEAAFRMVPTRWMTFDMRKLVPS
jgi:nitroimidazol reductase NimA-like FMN-containing flavoprotein (pyridoxamine 5'-phosphate oxidase superfamily)